MASPSQIADITRGIFAVVNAETQKAIDSQLSGQNLLKWTSPVALGSVFRVCDHPSSLSIDCPGTIFHTWESFNAIQQQWVLELGVAGYRIKNPHNGRYITAKPDSFLSGEVNSTQEFKFEGSSAEGYHIIDAGNNGQEVQFEQGGDRKSGTKLVLGAGRTQKWFLEPF